MVTICGCSPGKVELDCLSLNGYNRDCYHLRDSVLDLICQIEKGETLDSSWRVEMSFDSTFSDSLILFEKPYGRAFAKDFSRLSSTVERQYFRIDNIYTAVVFPKLDGRKEIDSLKTYMNVLLFQDSTVVLFRNVVGVLVGENYPNIDKIEKYYWKRLKKVFGIEGALKP